MIDAVALYAQVVEIALPIAIAFSVGNLLITTFLTACFKGRLQF